MLSSSGRWSEYCSHRECSCWLWRRPHHFDWSSYKSHRLGMSQPCLFCLLFDLWMLFKHYGFLISHLDHEDDSRNLDGSLYHKEFPLFLFPFPPLPPSFLVLHLRSFLPSSPLSPILSSLPPGSLPSC